MSQETDPKPSKKDWRARCVVILSCLNLAALCVVSYLLFVVSETWWVGTVLTYAPRTPYLIPAVVLLIASVLWQRESIGINVVSMAIVLIPIMGLTLPLDHWLDGSSIKEGEFSLKVVSCNVQAFQPDFDKVLEEIADISPDIVAMQEAFRGDPRLDEFFRNWHTVRHGQLFIGSRFPLTFVTDCNVSQFGGRMAAMMVEIETPGGSVVVSTIHQMTPRHGLKKLSRKTLVDLSGTKKLENFENERYEEFVEVRSMINSYRGDRPMIACGDFNAPSSSVLFRKNWGDLKCAFDIAGIGYGYTSPCKGNRFWPDNLPWARIDHILCTNEFTVRDCRIGVSDGSDHRLITATVALTTSRQ